MDETVPVSQQPPVTTVAALTPEQVLAAFQNKAPRDRTDQDLQLLGQTNTAAAQIQDLDLQASAITTDGLASLGQLPALRRLNLTGVQVIGTAWSPLGKLVALEWLSLEFPLGLLSPIPTILVNGKLSLS